MDSISKQQKNLQSLEHQVEQLQALAGDNQQAVRQLRELQQKINAMRVLEANFDIQALRPALQVVLAGAAVLVVVSARRAWLRRGALRPAT